ncbi:amidohydrolase 2 [Thozetella sp. PMI_491]|nr:amidohydrolase 2 [Thozetella sp. PMI_491]
MASQTVSIPIIDSHIHLYPASELDTLAWCTPDSPLAKQHSLEEYAAATGSPANLRGFVFLETDRKNAESSDWTQPLAEIGWLRRIAAGEPRPGEGHGPDDAKLVLGIIPWAPVDLGPAKLQEYLSKAEETAGPVWGKVKGFRYLLQDKPNGAMLTDEFIEGLKLLGKQGLVFDLGVDQHRRGRIQLEEAVDMIDRAHEDVEEDEKVVFILNHLCKPDLSIINQTDPAFIAWRTAMFTLSKCKKTYMKLSGCFSEMPDSLKKKTAEEVFVDIFPWLAVVLAAFGPNRIMFGSDWPVCTVGVDDGAWEKWRKVVARTCDMASLTVDEQARIWGGTAQEAYSLEL